ncbi:AAA domain-containing protein [Luteibacter aegosomatis]|uniref:DEAD/DEAH box helicase n=1 Tax=Luteibacter aegosomatis TaxID=2911537 RepID=UPI001FF73154|nr:AAA domain-containing protein [Luteibacter aegosomatis]UPG87628.1 AAA domain-containing protein [Luteibacter aegosomatis]
MKGQKHRYDSLVHPTSVGAPVLPWHPGSIMRGKAIPKGWAWSHTVYVHAYDSRIVAEQLKKIFVPDLGYSEPQQRTSTVFAVKFDEQGAMVPDSLVLSSEAWFLGKALNGNDWTLGFDADQKRAREHAQTTFETPATGDALRALTHWILDLLQVRDVFGDADAARVHIRSQPIRKKKPEREDDPLNSFLLDDLSAVATSVGQGVISEPLRRYLSRHDESARFTIDERASGPACIESLFPHTYAPGCWPSERHLGLVHSQQLAVNRILSTLGTGQGLIGINGPPGTGKTTLLRDLIAAIVVQRADVLAGLNRASDAFTGSLEKANGVEGECIGYPLRDALHGFEIVVASSNNGAVENITLELPQRDRVDESWLPEAEHFADVASLLAGSDAWGLVSGALGSQSRRKAFVERYFDGKRPRAPTAEEAAAEAMADESMEEEEETSHPLADLFAAGETTDTEGADANPESPSKGINAYLSEYVDANKGRSPSDRQAMWKIAVSEYLAAKARVDTCREDADRIRLLLPNAIKRGGSVLATRKKLAALRATLLDIKLKKALEENKGVEIGERLDASLDALNRHDRLRPGFWSNLFSLWRAGRLWADARVRLAREYKDATTAADIASIQDELARLESQHATLRQSIAALAATHGATHLEQWAHTGSLDLTHAIELAEPWMIEGHRRARAGVFIQALKLHRTFMELEPKRVRSNLSLANAIVMGARYQGLSHDAIRSAWATLFMVVPVLSSTFASFARSFGSLRKGDIGWLLVDEAGQATPQAAVGALWRSRRAVLVGDPMQLKPIVTVSDAVLEGMRTIYRVDPHWLPSRQSAQTLADEATTWGRRIGPSGAKAWVGLPLVVHRRCDRPMYTLANRIAYDGAMVYGTIAPKPARETPASLPTGWFRARGPSQGNWVPAEGEVLSLLLARLAREGVKTSDIAVVTPFKEVRQRLSPLLPKGMTFGTIHTMQGKESAVVIMVMGGHADAPGARDWAVAEPNLLNVAATRAKRRFYVIGDQDDWRHRNLFRDVMELLPVQDLSERDPHVATSFQA